MLESIQEVTKVVFLVRHGRKSIKCIQSLKVVNFNIYSRPRWISWMLHPTGDQEVAGSTPAEWATFFRGD